MLIRFVASLSLACCICTGDAIGLLAISQLIPEESLVI